MTNGADELGGIKLGHTGGANKPANLELPELVLDPDWLGLCWPVLWDAAIGGGGEVNCICAAGGFC